MTKSQSDAAPETVPSGDAANSDATTKLPTGGTPSATDPGPGARPRIGKKSAWALGGVIVVAVLSVVLSATARLSLSGGKTPITMAGAASAAAPSASIPGPDAGTVAPLVSKSAASYKAASTPSAAPTGAATTTPSPAATIAPAV